MSDGTDQSMYLKKYLGNDGWTGIGHAILTTLGSKYDDRLQLPQTTLEFYSSALYGAVPEAAVEA